MAEAGVDVRIGITVTGKRRPGGTGPVTLTLEDDGEVKADEALFATGRQPLTDDIGLDTVGLAPGSWLEVNDTLHGPRPDRRLAVRPGRCQPPRPAHPPGQVPGPHRRGGDRRPRRRTAHRPCPVGPARHHRRLPRSAAGVLLRPPAETVGLTADQAERAGHRIRVADVNPGETGPGLYADGYTGRARMIVDEDHGYLLGVTFVGPGVEELIHSATIAVAGQVPISRLWHAVPCFPSISDVWLRLLEAYGT